MTERHAEATLATATALNPHIGYDRAAEIVKAAAESGRSLREVALEQGVEPGVLEQAWTTAAWPSARVAEPARSDHRAARSGDSIPGGSDVAASAEG